MHCSTADAVHASVFGGFGFFFFTFSTCSWTSDPEVDSAGFFGTERGTGCWKVQNSGRVCRVPLGFGTESGMDYWREWLICGADRFPVGWHRKWYGPLDVKMFIQRFWLDSGFRLLRQSTELNFTKFFCVKVDPGRPLWKILRIQPSAWFNSRYMHLRQSTEVFSLRAHSNVWNDA